MLRLALLLLFVAAAGCAPETVRTVHTKSYITIAYEGRLPDGTVFDSSPRKAFQLSNTIEGFQIHLRGMAVGETRTFDVPPEYGYGDDPPEGIPPNTTLTFTVTLLRTQ